ncbi:MAG: hypothetical protein PHT62_11820 [Desulfotomaculaceae bacterium]|nr:hypothetical protein [Desulfotomaculaceae bacterium]
MSTVKLQQLFDYIDTLPITEDDREKLIKLIQEAEDEAINSVFFASTGMK